MCLLMEVHNNNSEVLLLKNWTRILSSISSSNCPFVGNRRGKEMCSIIPQGGHPQKFRLWKMLWDKPLISLSNKLQGKKMEKVNRNLYIKWGLLPIAVSWVYQILIPTSSSQPGVVLSPKGHLKISGEICICHMWGKGSVGMQTTSTRYKPGIWLLILQCTRQPPHKK